VIFAFVATTSPPRGEGKGLLRGFGLSPSSGSSGDEDDEPDEGLKLNALVKTMKL